MTLTSLPAALRRTPRALLLDFGGVIILTAKRPEGRREFAQALSRRLEEAGAPVAAERLEQCLAAGAAGLKHWKHSSSRRREPRELTVAEIIGDFYFSDLEDPARALLTGWGAELLDEMSTALTDHNLRDGVPELISYAQQNGIALGIVSNAHSGRSHRRLLTALGLDGVFGTQIYSDEAGIRKPHPDMLGRAARGLGVDLKDAWYVGDTMDRDLVAGRRAGVGAVILTRSQHTDNPPFPIDDTAEAVVDNPAELLQLLQATEPAEVLAAESDPAVDQDDAAGTAVSSGAVPVRALLLDHGGVISDAVKPQQPFAEAAEAVEQALLRAGCPVAEGRGLQIIEAAHQRYKEYKDAQEAQGTYKEVTPRLYWGEFTKESVTPQQTEVLLAEAESLQMPLYRSKSHKREREGIRDLLLHCKAAGITVIIVSNTICGRGVRSIIAGYALDHLVAGWVCSDELGLKKPHPDIFRYALRMASVAPEEAAMVGDKPFNDAMGAQQVGIGRRILTRGGSGTDAELQQALETGWATSVVDHPGQILALLN